MAELIRRGEQVYAKNCVVCHQATGKGTPPAFPPMDGSKMVLGPKEEQIKTILNGRPKTAMVAFAGQLNDVELAASMIGISTPNSALKRFDAEIKEGRVLLMLDIPKGRVREFQGMVHRKYSEASDHGLEPTMPAFP